MESDIWGFNKVLRICVLTFYLLVISGNEGEIATVGDYYEESLFFELVEPEEIAYTYKIKPAKNFGLSMNVTLIDIELVPSIPADACNYITNELSLYGNVALVQRGTCSFLTKAINVEQAGAKAVIIMDDNASNDETLVDMVDDGSERLTRISAYFLLGKDGLVLLSCKFGSHQLDNYVKYMIKECLNRLQLSYAIINIPINATLSPYLPRPQPPWSIW